MQTITLKNDVSHPVSWCGAAEGFLYAELLDVSDIVAAAQEFSDQSATEKIVYRYADEMSETHIGYQALCDVKKNLQTGHVTVALARQ